MLKLLSALAWVLFPAALFAQPISSVHQVAIVVLPLDTDAHECGLQDDALLADARLPIAAAGIGLNNSPKLGDPTLYVAVSVLKHRGDCVVNLQMVLSASAYFSRSKGEAVTVNTWNKNYLVAGPPGQIAQTIDRTAETLAKQFASAVLGAR